MSIIAALFGKIVATKFGAAGLGAVGALLLSQAVPLVKPLMGKLIKAQIDKVLEPDLKDPKEKELLKNLALAAIAYAEYKIPDRGEGKAKKALASSALARFLPGVAGQVAAELIQEAFDSLDDDLKKRLGAGGTVKGLSIEIQGDRGVVVSPAPATFPSRPVN